MNQLAFKKSSLIFFFLCATHYSIEAITPREVQGASIIASLEILIMPIAFDLLDGMQGIYHNNKQFWLEYAVASVVGGALTYYVLNKYTPQSKYNWALSVKYKQDKALSYDEGSLNRMQVLYNYYHEIARAIDYLNSAPDDIPEDHSFKLDCEQLINELKTVQAVVEICAGVTAEEWFKDLTRYPVPKGNVNAVEWAGKLIGKLPGIDYMWSAL